MEVPTHTLRLHYISVNKHLIPGLNNDSKKNITTQNKSKLCLTMSFYEIY